MKKNIKELINVIELFLLLSYFATAQVALNNLKGRAELSVGSIKQSFVKGELIDVEVTLKNLTGSPLVIVYQGGSDRWVFLRAVDENGEELRNLAPVFTNIGFDTLTVPPNGELVRQGSVSYLLGNDNSMPGVYEFLPGKYRVWAEFGVLRSNSREFVVTELPANEKEVKDKFYHELAGASTKEAVKIAKKLISDYPKSVYLPSIYLKLFTALAFENSTNELKAKTIEFMDRFPLSSTANEAVYYYKEAIIKGMGVIKESDLSPEKRKNLNEQLKELKERYSGNARISRRVDEMIKTDYKPSRN